MDGEERHEEIKDGVVGTSYKGKDKGLKGKKAVHFPLRKYEKRINGVPH